MVPESTFDDVVAPYAIKRSRFLFFCVEGLIRESLFLWVRLRLMVQMDQLLLTVSKLRLLVKVFHGCWTV